MSLLLLDVQLTQQFCLCLIDKMKLFDDSMIILHNTCQILTNCTKEQLLASVTATGTFKKTSPSPVKFWFDTKCFFLRHMDLNSRFDVMTTDVIKQMPLNFGVLSSFGYTIAHCCISVRSSAFDVLRQTRPWFRSVSIRINVPTINHKSFLQHIQGRVCVLS